MWTLNFWLRSPGAVAEFHGARPDAPGHAGHDRVFGIEAVAEEEGEIRREGVHREPPGQVVLDVGEAVRESEGELGDGVRSGFGDVVARDGDRVEVPHPALDEVLLDVPP